MEPDPTFIDFICPRCLKKMSYPSFDKGRVRECPICGKSIVVPSNGEDTAGDLPIPLALPRLLLRYIIDSDKEMLRNFLCQANLSQFGDWNTVDEPTFSDWFQWSLSCRIASFDGNLVLVAQTLQNSTFVGLVTLCNYDDPPGSGAFRVVIDPPHRRSGYGTEIVSAVLDFAFATLHLRRMAVSCDAQNIPAAKMLRTVGMRHEGTFVEDTLVKDKYRSTSWYAMLDREYYERRPAS